MRFSIDSFQMEEFVNHGYHPKSEHVHGQLFITSAQTPTFLIPTVHSFDEVTLAIGPFVKVRRWGLIFPSRDYRLDTMSFEPPAHVGVTVAPITRHVVRPIRLPGMACQEHMFQQRLEAPALMAFAPSQVNADYDAVLFHQQRHLGAEATPRVAQRMFCWLNELHSVATSQLRWRRRVLAGATGST